MKSKWMHILLLVMALALILSACGQSNAPYPNKDITILIPWAQGGSTDFLMRTIAVPMKSNLGGKVQINVKNVPGGAGTIGTAEFANAKPDGYTPLYTFAGPLISQPHLQKLPYDSREFVPVAGTVSEIFALMVKGDAPYKNMKEFESYFKQPGKELHYGTSGAGTLNHLCGVQLSRQLKMPMTHVPFKSTQEAVNAVLGGTLDFSVAEPPSFAASVQEGRARLLMIMGDKRYEDKWPGVPCSKELGYDLIAGGWAAVFLQKGAPQDVVDKLGSAYRKAMDDPEVLKVLANLQQPVWNVSGEEVGKRLQKEYSLVGELLKAEGLAK